MVGVAILGAGIFARSATLPAVQASITLQLRAVWSRSEKSATEFQRHIEAGRDPTTPTSPSDAPLKVYWDSPAPSTPGRTLDDLLADDGVPVVICALPILSQPDVIRRALQAGKHVLSEKPVAADVAAARELVAWYDALAPAGGRPRGLWGVAENYRYVPSLDFAAAELARIGGDVVAFSLRKHSFSVGGAYFNTEWRKVPGYQGGYLLDGGVHFVAALRRLLAAAGPLNELERVAGFTAQVEERLPPVDTIMGVARTRGGRAGTVALSFGTQFKIMHEVEVLTSRGRVAWSHELVTTTEAAADDPEGKRTVTRETPFGYDGGVAAEVEAFGRSVAAGRLDAGLSPGEALKDLQIIEAFLGSGKAHGAVTSLGE